MTEQRLTNAVEPVLKQSRSDAATSTVGRWFANAFKRWQRNQVIARMHDLDDKLLADIGITRGEITQAVDGLLNEDRKAKDVRINSAKLAQSGERSKLAA